MVKVCGFSIGIADPTPHIRILVVLWIRLWIWVVALVLGCVLDCCIGFGELLRFRDYCISF